MKFPLCFVLMPFGKKSDQGGFIIDFDSVYKELINPAIKSAELDPIRADEEIVGGIIHKPMFERLVLCEFAVADLTDANANVFYELGVCHAVPTIQVLYFYMLKIQFSYLLMLTHFELYLTSSMRLESLKQIILIRLKRRLQKDSLKLKIREPIVLYISSWKDFQISNI